MKVMRLFLIRHGQTEFNAKNIVQGGGIDSDIDETGKKQSIQFFEKYKEHPFAGYYATTLKRTAQTLSPFNSLGHNITCLSGFNELGWGAIEGMEQTEEVKAHFYEVLVNWKNGMLDYATPGGETPNQVWNRCKQALDTIFTFHPTGDVLICVHGRTLRILLSQLLGYGMEYMHLFNHPNVCLNVLKRIGRTGYKFTAEKLIDVSHLK